MTHAKSLKELFALFDAAPPASSFEMWIDYKLLRIGCCEVIPMLSPIIAGCDYVTLHYAIVGIESGISMLVSSIECYKMEESEVVGGKFIPVGPYQTHLPAR